MIKDYSQFIVKDYQYWTVSIHENQGYLGRCVIWCKREDALDLGDATHEEMNELLSILKNLKAASSKCFHPDWFNYAFLGNETQHLHGHFIPRYAHPRELMGVTFKDKLYGHHYKTDHSIVISPELLQSIKGQLSEALH